MKEHFKGKHGPLLIAEIGGNHEGDFAYAKKLTQLAIEADVDFVKFQLYTGNGIVSPVESPTRNEHFKKFELSQEQHIELAEMVTKAGIQYTASVWDTEMFSWIDSYIPIYKIGSGDLTAYPVIKKIVSTEKPIILSTGIAYEHEVIDTVSYIQSLNKIYKQKDMLGILQCTSMYPIPNTDAHLNVMHSLRSLTGLSIGYSDHTVGTDALEYATAMGAEILEFHFTDTREGKSFRDHKVSLTCDEVKKLIQKITTIQELQGDSYKQPLPIETENEHDISFRRAVYLNKNIPAHTIITENDIICLRPLHGIDAREADTIIGRKTLVDIPAFTKLDYSYFE